jgi:hypothetical protein
MKTIKSRIVSQRKQLLTYQCSSNTAFRKLKSNSNNDRLPAHKWGEMMKK